MSVPDSEKSEAEHEPVKNRPSEMPQDVPTLSRNVGLASLEATLNRLSASFEVASPRTASDDTLREQITEQARTIEALRCDLQRIEKYRNGPSKRSEAFSRIIEIATLIVIAMGLFFAWDQAKKLTESIEASSRNNNLATWNTVTTDGIEVDKVFIDNPEYQKYFFSGVSISKSDKQFEKANAIATIMLDYFDSVLSLLKYMDETPAMKGQDPFIERQTWNLYFTSVFKTSPLMCTALEDSWSIYGKELKRIGGSACGISDH